MKLRNKSGDALDVPLLGRTVQPDEVVEVPDEWYAEPQYEDHDGERVVVGWSEGYAWPEETWHVVGTRAAKKSETKDEE